jgi:hypothetical protein
VGLAIVKKGLLNSNAGKNTSGAFTMPLKTRGSKTIDKAQRRLASLKSIDENLDLGYGLTVARYVEAIETTRKAIASYNTLVSTLDEARRNVDTLETNLAELTARMLTAVSTKYGRNSNEYRKAGGKTRKSRNNTTQPETDSAPATPHLNTSETPIAIVPAIVPVTNNGKQVEQIM